MKVVEKITESGYYAIQNDLFNVDGGFHDRVYRVLQAILFDDNYPYWAGERVFPQGVHFVIDGKIGDVDNYMHGWENVKIVKLDLEQIINNSEQKGNHSNESE